jgi:hypothetical protein
MGRFLTWVSDQRFQGWACSQCEWNCPLPTLLADPEAKSAFDRLASGKFLSHDCREHNKSVRRVDSEGFAERARKLVRRGFKPKDAADITLQEIMLEHRHEPGVEKRARADAEDFLRRVKDGLI